MIESHHLECSVDAARLTCLRFQTADIGLAISRIASGPRTARRVGKLRKQRAAVDELVRGRAEKIIGEGCRHSTS